MIAQDLPRYIGRRGKTENNSGGRHQGPRLAADATKQTTTVHRAPLRLRPHEAARLPSGTLYPMLARLQNEGLATSPVGTPARRQYPDGRPASTTSSPRKAPAQPPRTRPRIPRRATAPPSPQPAAPDDARPRPHPSGSPSTSSATPAATSPRTSATTAAANGQQNSPPSAVTPRAAPRSGRSARGDTLPVPLRARTQPAWR